MRENNDHKWAPPKERYYTVKILLDSEKGMFLSEAIKKNLSNADLNDRERAFIIRESKGVTERLLTLSYLVDQTSRIPVEKLDSEVRAILRLGLYEIFFDELIPDHAAVNEAVELVKAFKRPGLSGFVNGVLRNAGRNKEKLTKAYMEQPHIRYSVPKWLYDMWKVEFGFNETEKMCAAALVEKPICVRVNSLKTTPDILFEELNACGIRVERVSGNENALILSDTGDITRLSAFSEGRFYVCDLSSQAVVDGAVLKKGDHVLDLCAAPGGKTVGAALAVGGEGSVVSCDKSRKKTALIEENVSRLGLNNVKTLVNDCEKLNEDFYDRFDVVIADLPCSGLGVISHKPDVKYRLKREDIEALSRLQRRMLDAAARYVKPGGRLLYSTCTVSRKENEGNVKAFLETHPMYSLGRMEQRFICPEYDGFFTAEFVL